MTTALKITPELFVAKINNSEYAGAGGARKALAKAHFTDKVKKELGSIIDTHFGVAGAKSVPAPGMKRDGTPKAKPGRKHGTHVIKSESHHIDLVVKAEPLVPTQPVESPNQHIAQSITSVSAAIEALYKVFEMDKTFNVQPAVQHSGRALTHLLEELHDGLGLESTQVGGLEPEELTFETAEVESTKVPNGNHSTIVQGMNQMVERLKNGVASMAHS